MCTFVANLPAVRALLAAGADLNLEAGAGWTALHIACMAANGHEAVAVLLAAGGANQCPSFNSQQYRAGDSSAERHPGHCRAAAQVRRCGTQSAS